MTDLQWALLGAGGVLVAGVWGHGKWQEARQRKLAASLLNPEAGDPLMERRPGPPGKAVKAARKVEAPAPVERREPVIGQSDDLSADDLAPERPQPSPPERAPAVMAAVRPSAPRLAPEFEPDTALVSDEADFVARLSLPEAMLGETLLAVPREPFATLRKRIAWIGFEETTRRWEHLEPQGRYAELRIGLQLADRSGPVNSALIDQFRRAIERIGDELTAVPAFPPAREALARAVSLDRLCAEVDIQLAVHLAPRHDHLVPDLVRDMALERGFRLASDGQLGYFNAAGERLFVLQMPDARAPDGLPAPTAICLLEVPCVTDGEPAFDRMMAVAQELAEALDALLVDEQRRPITERFVGPVRQQIGQLQNRMAAQGVVAGSPLALRLFS